MSIFVKDWRQGLDPFDPETEGKRSNTLMAMRVLPTKYLDSVSEPQAITPGNRRWEEDAANVMNWKTLPGYTKDIGGTWVSPPTLPSLQTPDIPPEFGKPMSLVGIAGRKIMDSPDWHSERANYEGFKYDGFDENKYRLISQGFPGAEYTTLDDLRRAAGWIDAGLEPTNNKQLLALVNALKRAGIGSTIGSDKDFAESHWAPSVTELPAWARTDHPRILVGEPMDIAMQLLKAPLLLGSIKDAGTDKYGINEYTADFEHPETGEIYPMQGYVGRDEAGTFIYPPNVKPPKESPPTAGDGQPLAGAIGEAVFMPHADYPNPQEKEWTGAPYIQGRDPTIPEDYQRPVGMGTAMYDLAAIMADKQGAKIVPGAKRSHQAHNMWAKHEDKGHWPVKTGEPMDLAMRLLKEEEPWDMYSDWRYLKNPENPDLTSDEPFTCGLYPEHHRLAGEIDTHPIFGGCGKTKPLSEFTRHILTNPKWRTSGGWPTHSVPDQVICNDCKARSYVRFAPLANALMQHIEENPDGFEQELGELPSGMKISDEALVDPDEEKWRSNIETGEPMEIAMRLLKMPQEAKDYATQIHEGQMYGEQPYMNHVENVASGFDDPHLQRIAYLHDTVEDSETGIGEIHERFGEDVGHAVDALTRRQGEQYFDYINRVKEHPEATQVKLADLHSNLKNNPNESLAKRYQKAIGILTNKSEPMNIAMRLLKEKKGLADDYDDDDLYNDDVPRQTYQEMFGEAPPEVHPGHMESLSRTRGIGTRHGIKLDSDYNIEDIPDKSLVDQAHDVSQAYHDAYMSGKYEPGEFGPWWQGLPKQSKTLGSEFADENLINRFRSEKHPDGSPVKDIIDVAALSGKEVPLHLNTVSLPDETGEITTAPSFYNMPYNKKTGFTRSEPMEIAMQLLKERVSPEAKRHKLEYDTKYESSPERVKYREELNRERRRRGMYGDHSHRDISHTEGSKLTVEDEHSNRSRHFKDKGTLRSDTKKADIAVKQPKPNDRKPIAVKEVGDYYA